MKMWPISLSSRGLVALIDRGQPRGRGAPPLAGGTFSSASRTHARTHTRRRVCAREGWRGEGGTGLLTKIWPWPCFRAALLSKHIRAPGPGFAESLSLTHTHTTHTLSLTHSLTHFLSLARSLSLSRAEHIRASGPGFSESPKLFDYVSVGILAPWKRHARILVRNKTQ